MELKPNKSSKQGTRKRARLDGVGGWIPGGEGTNPWHTLARGLEPKHGNKRRRPFADTLGATPPRDGPFARAAEDVAIQKPPKTRQRRSQDAASPFMLPRMKQP